MNRFFLYAGVLLLLAATAIPAAQAEPLNFTIGYINDPGPEGPGIKRPYLAVGRRKVSFRLPQHCNVSSAADNLTVLVNQNGVSGQFTVTNSPYAPSQDFTAQVDDYRVASEKSLPKEGLKVKFIGGQFDRYRINEWKSLSFDWEYSFFAHPVKRQTSYVNLDADYQICLTIISDEDSWKATEAMADRFMKSWYWME